MIPIWWLATLAALNTFTAGSALSEIMPMKWVGFCALVVASLQAGTAVFQANANLRYSGNHRR